MDASQAKQEELTVELRRARRWILAVGILLFAFDMYTAWYGAGKDWPPEVKHWVSFFDGLILGAFVALWWFARRWPRTCCVLALVVYWGLQILAATQDSSLLYKGILIKVFFTVALIQGIRSAHRAATLKEELAEIFA